ncbi:MAG: hypothetical protein ACWIPH_07805 [Ostreibacterium sp.]
MLEQAIDELVLTTGIKDRKRHERYLLSNYDSPLIRRFFYSNLSPLKLYKETKAISPLVASSPVEGVLGSGEGSQQQGTETPPSCGEWWSGSNGLRYRLVNTMKKSLAVKVANDLGVEDCRNDIIGSIRDGTLSGMSMARKAACTQKVTDTLYSGNGDKLTRAMFKTVQGQGSTDDVLSGSESGKLTALAAVGVGSSILSFITGKDLSMGLISQATSFYMTIFMLKLMLKYLIPMILMAIYMFWGIYLTVGEFRGMAMIKGMILIIAISAMPGLWAIVDHLDDTLYAAMYDGTSEGGGYFNMLLLDITTGIFQIAIVFVLFYLIGEAGGGNAKGVMSSDQNFNKSASSDVGGAAGRGLGKSGQWGGNKASNYLKNFSKTKGK